MKVYLGADHAGFEFKENLKNFLQEKGYEVEDCGAFELNPIDDYPDFIAPAARKVAETPGSFGIVLGKSGAGECIVANKIKGIRAFLGISEQNVRLAREHNDANVISFGSELVDFEKAKQLVELFLTTPFSNEDRHIRRIEKIRNLENA
ncbi:MAG: RpiB/LacA/LacB family sugar-phosphate isomerase [Candidatus Levybacteria bacterium]|nr:RpiB/LacA/LacB family sugar-phosphate isomerase [Candidatus Levybacteria bacterium]